MAYSRECDSFNLSVSILFDYIVQQMLLSLSSRVLRLAYVRSRIEQVHV